MLIAKIEKTIELVEKKHKLEKQHQQLQSVSNINQDIDSAMDILTRPPQMVNAITEHFTSCPVKVDGYTVQLLLEEIDSLVKQADTLCLPDKATLKKIINTCKNLDESMKRDWVKYITAENQELLDFLATIEPLVSDRLISQVKEIKIAVHNAKTKWPLSKQDLLNLIDAGRAGVSIIENMEVTDGVRDFLTLVTKGEATIGHLTEEIMSWIREQKLNNKLKINF